MHSMYNNHPSTNMNHVIRNIAVLVKFMFWKKRRKYVVTLFHVKFLFNKMLHIDASIICVQS